MADKEVESKLGEVKQAIEDQSMKGEQGDQRIVDALHDVEQSTDENTETQHQIGDNIRANTAAVVERAKAMMESFRTNFEELYGKFSEFALAIGDRFWKGLNLLTFNLPNKFKEGLVSFWGLDFKEKMERVFGAIRAIPKAIASVFDKIPGVNAVKKGLGTFFDILKNAALLAAGILGLQAFLEGWDDAEKWFGDNPDFGQRIASALANVLATFFGLDEETERAIAVGIDEFFVKVGKLFGELFEGVKLVAQGIFSGDSGKIREGLNKIYDALSGAFISLATSIAGFFGVSEEDQEIIKQKLTQFFSELKEIAVLFGNIVGDLWNIVTGDGSWSQLADSLVKFSEKVLGALGLDGALDYVREIGQKLGSGVSMLFNLVDEYLITPITNLFNWIYDNVSRIAEYLGIDIADPTIRKDRLQEDLNNLLFEIRDEAAANGRENNPRYEALKEEYERKFAEKQRIEANPGRLGNRSANDLRNELSERQSLENQERLANDNLGSGTGEFTQVNQSAQVQNQFIGGTPNPGAGGSMKYQTN